MRFCEKNINIKKWFASTRFSPQNLTWSSCICILLEGVVRGEEVFGEGASDIGRLRVMLESGSRVGAEFSESWRILKAEAESAAEWLGS